MSKFKAESSKYKVVIFVGKNFRTELIEKEIEKLGFSAEEILFLKDQDKTVEQLIDENKLKIEKNSDEQTIGIVCAHGRTEKIHDPLTNSTSLTHYIGSSVSSDIDKKLRKLFKNIMYDSCQSGAILKPILKKQDKKKQITNQVESATTLTISPDKHNVFSPFSNQSIVDILRLAKQNKIGSEEIPKQTARQIPETFYLQDEKDIVPKFSRPGKLVASDIKELLIKTLMRELEQEKSASEISKIVESIMKAVASSGKQDFGNSRITEIISPVLSKLLPSEDMEITRGLILAELAVQVQTKIAEKLTFLKEKDEKKQTVDAEYVTTLTISSSKYSAFSLLGNQSIVDILRLVKHNKDRISSEEMLKQTARQTVETVYLQDKKGMVFKSSRPGKLVASEIKELLIKTLMRELEQEKSESEISKIVEALMVFFTSSGKQDFSNFRITEIVSVALSQLLPSKNMEVVRGLILTELALQVQKKITGKLTSEEIENYLSSRFRGNSKLDTKDGKEKLNLPKTSQRHYQEDLLLLATLRGTYEVIEALLNQENKDLSNTKYQDATALMYAIISRSPSDIVLSIAELLINNNIDLGAKDEIGSTALMYAVNQGRLSIVNLLVEKGNIELINMSNNKGVTALASAAYLGHLEITKSLIKAGADIDKIFNCNVMQVQKFLNDNLTEIISNSLSTNKDEINEKNSKVISAFLNKKTSEERQNLLQKMSQKNSELAEKLSEILKNSSLDSKSESVTTSDSSIPDPTPDSLTIKPKKLNDAKEINKDSR